MSSGRFLLALCAVLAIPLAAAQEPDSIRIQMDSDETVFQVHEPLTGADAADLRGEIDDDYGNGDGTVQAREIEAYQADNQHSFEQNRPECFADFEFIRLEGRAPLRLAEVREEVVGVLNTKASSTAPLQQVAILRFAYPRAPSDTVTVTLRMGDMESMGEAVACSIGAGFDDFGDGPWLTPMAEGFTWPAAPTTHSGAQEAPDTIYQIRPLEGARILRESVRPDAARNLWDGQGLRADTDQEASVLFTNQITFTSDGGADAPAYLDGTARDVGAVIGYTTVGVVSLAGVAALFVEFLRYKFLKLLILVPGFSRLEKDEVLEHTKRDELYRFIKTSPGPSFSDLRRELGLSNGTLVHHLRILEAQEYVKPVRDGFRTRFYIRGPKIVTTSYLTRTQQQVLDAIAGNPGLTQKELSLVLGLPRESVSYHTKQLAQKGRLEIKQDGKWRRYWPPAPAQPTPAGASRPSQA